MKDNFRRQLGYVLDDKDISICGYEADVVMFQNTTISFIVHRRVMNHDGKGVYFRYRNKKHYVYKNS